MRSAAWLMISAFGVTSPLSAYADSAAKKGLELDVHKWRVIESESGKVNYYTVVDSPDLPFIRARYRPPYKTAVLGFEIEGLDRQRASRLKWRWRAMVLPNGGNECAEGKGDSAAVVYLSWKRGMRWYTLKYVWSAVGPKASICGRKRNPFLAQDTIILESGGPLGVWRDEVIDLKSEFRRHFEGGDANASVPDFAGAGLMTDGDQTRSESAADYAQIVLER